MGIDTSKIEHILRTRYGWERFPLNEDLEKKSEEKKYISKKVDPSFTQGKTTSIFFS